MPIVPIGISPGFPDEGYTLFVALSLAMSDLSTSRYSLCSLSIHSSPAPACEATDAQQQSDRSQSIITTFASAVQTLQCRKGGCGKKQNSNLAPKIVDNHSQPPLRCCCGPKCHQGSCGEKWINNSQPLFVSSISFRHKKAHFQHGQAQLGQVEMVHQNPSR
jgi:hypothetical protein